MLTCLWCLLLSIRVFLIYSRCVIWINWNHCDWLIDIQAVCSCCPCIQESNTRCTTSATVAYGRSKRFAFCCGFRSVFGCVCSKALKFLLFVNIVNMQMSHFISDHFSGPGRTVIQVSVWTVTSELNDLGPRYLACWSCSEMKVIGQSSWSQVGKVLLKWSVQPRVRVFWFHENSDSFLCL